MQLRMQLHPPSATPGRRAEYPPVQAVEGAQYLSKRDDVDQYLHVMEGIRVRSGPPDTTVEILTKILRET